MIKNIIAGAVFSIVFIVVLGQDISTKSPTGNEKHENCLNYEAQFQNGEKVFDVLNGCGLKNRDDFENKTAFFCVLEKSGNLSENKTVSILKVAVNIPRISYVEHSSSIALLVLKCIATESDWPLCAARNMWEICPNDVIFRKKN